MRVSPCLNHAKQRVSPFPQAREAPGKPNPAPDRFVGAYRDLGNTEWGAPELLDSLHILQCEETIYLKSMRPGVFCDFFEVKIVIYVPLETTSRYSRLRLGGALELERLAAVLLQVVGLQR